MSSIFLACLTSWLNIRNIKYLITTVVKFLHENCRQFPSDVIYVRNLATKNIFDVVGHGDTDCSATSGLHIFLHSR